MVQANAQHDEFADGFDADDQFVDGNDPFLDAEAVERAILGEKIDPSVQHRSGEEERQRPFGARLAEANAVEGGFLDDEAGDLGAFEPSEPGPVLSEAPALVDMDDDEARLLTQPVPRITIHAFCESPATGQVIQRAGDDRRLARAHVAVELGGLAAAIERYHDEDTPNLLIVETGMRGRELFLQLEELASVCDPDTKVVIVGAANDIALYRELIRRGVSEYLVPPMSPLSVIKTVAGLFLDPEAPFAGKTLAFVGAKGGVGASTVAHNTAWCLTEKLRSDAVLVDLDLSFGTAGLDFNQDPAQTIAEALAAPDRLDDNLLDRLLVRCTDRLSLFSAPATLEKDWDFDPDVYDEVIDKVRRQAPHVVLDLPHAWSPWVRQTILSADQVVVVVTPDLACLRNAKNLFDLVRTARPNDEPPKVVVNMAGCPKRPDIPLKDFSDALGAEPVLVLPFEPQLFGKAANNGQMIAELEPRSKAAEGFEHLAALVGGRGAMSGARAAAGSKSLFGALFKKKR